MIKAHLPIATLVERWQVVHGRSHLPWQQTRDPYRVWLSEVMLQQTQVKTVLDYYPRFLEHFPDIEALAIASEEDVFALWSGLGYYSRARNLHRCAQQVMLLHNGVFPQTVPELQSLPGIGRSTAGAIAAFCFAQRAPILDANVRRVLTRLLAFDADLAVSANEKALWHEATALLPHKNLAQSMPRYTQGLMDLGAMVCLPHKPLCTQCPLQQQCAAHRNGNPELYPVRTRKVVRKSESWWLLLLRDDLGRMSLERRADKGIWSGLHCVPVFAESSLLALHPSLKHAVKKTELPSFLHVLTHRDLYLHPVVVDVCATGSEGAVEGWFSRDQWQSLGLPSPIRKLLEAA